MKEHNSLRIQRILARFDAHTSGPEVEALRAAERRAVFLAELDRVVAEVLRPALDDVGGELTRAGHGYDVVSTTTAKGLPRFELRVRLRRGKPRFENAIVFFAAPSRSGDLEIVAELELGNAIELGRFESPAAMTRDVLEQMLVDAVEHMFACNE